MKFLTLASAATLAAAAGTANAVTPVSPWFTGYLDPNNTYRYYGFTDWDTPLFGPGINPDLNLLGIAPPAYAVDGHVLFEANGTGFATVIESTGSYAATGFSLGSVHPVSVQRSNWFSNPGFTPVSDTRGDYNAQFLNVLAEAVVPEPASLTLLGLGSVALLVRRRR